jgi:iron(III) transport system permease protein
VSTYQSEIFTQLAAFFNIDRAVIYSFPLVLLTALFSSSIYFYFKTTSFTTITSFFRKKEDFIFLSKASRVFAYVFLTSLILFSLAVPSLMMAVESGKEMLNALAIAYMQVINSLVLCTAAALAITFLGFIAYYFFRKDLLILTLFMLPLGISSPVIGISLINLYSKLPLPVYGSILMIVLGFVLRFLPFSIFIFSCFLPQISSSLEEYSRICKAKFLAKMQKIILPLTKGGILSSFILIFILCLGEIGATQMVSPPGFQTLSMRIETLMHYGNYSYVASLSLVLLLFIFMFYLIYVKMYEDYEREIY